MSNLDLILRAQSSSLAASLPQPDGYRLLVLIWVYLILILLDAGATAIQLLGKLDSTKNSLIHFGNLIFTVMDVLNESAIPTTMVGFLNHVCLSINSDNFFVTELRDAGIVNEMAKLDSHQQIKRSDSLVTAKRYD